MTNNLPKGWKNIKLGKILYLKNGYAFKNDDYIEAGIPLVRISDIDDGYVNLEKTVKISDNFKYDNFIIENGDILIAMSGATTGKYGIYLDCEKVYQNQRVGNLKLISESATNKKLVYYFLGLLKNEIEKKAYGGAQPNISGKLIEEMNILLPPLAEQNRIVEKLDKLFTNLDNLKTRTKSIPEILKQFRQSVLSAAVTGKLTEDWRKENGIEFEWEKKEFFDFFVLQRGFDLVLSKLKEGTVPVVTSAGISGFHDKFKVKSPGVTIGRSGSIGKAFFIEKDFWPHNTTLYVKDFKNNIPKYVYYFLLSFNINQFSSSTAVPTLNRNNLRNLFIKVPSISEQTEIVIRVEKLFALADKIEERYKQAREAINQLPHAILKKAFKGKLVPQNEEDEPVEKLLEKILKTKQENNSKQTEKKK